MHKKQWTKIGWAAGVGISIGIAAAALSVHRPSLEQSAAAKPVPYIVPVNETTPRYSVSRTQVDVADVPTDNAEVERLKTRNRRLEALVTVLRRRTAEHE